jgi:hypothetical protein
MPSFKPSLRNADTVHVNILEEFSQVIDVRCSPAGICVRELQSAIFLHFEVSEECEGFIEKMQIKRHIQNERHCR